MVKRKIAGAALAAALLCACTGAVLLSESTAASADSAQLTIQNANLFLPATYEQYLVLDNPTCMAKNDRYVAVADGKTIYLYDSEAEDAHYVTYVHQESAESVTVRKMQFTDEGTLYFSSAAGLFELDPSAETLSERALFSFSPYTFHVYGDRIYTVTAQDGESYLYFFMRSTRQLTLSDAVASARVGSGLEFSPPLISYANNTVFCAVSSTVLRYAADTLESQQSFLLNNRNTGDGLLNPYSICAANGGVYYTDINGLFFSDMQGNASPVRTGRTFGTLYSNNDLLYYIYDGGVHELELERETDTGYEIASYSSSVGRLSGARDIVRAGNLLVTADSRNNRLSVYDIAKAETTVIDLDYTPVLAATDGTMIAAASDTAVYIYERNREGEFVLSYRNLVNNTVSGITCLYGTCYFVTRGFGYGIASPDFTVADICMRDNGMDGFPPAALTSDLYGNLYVVRSDGSVFVYDELTFADRSVAAGKPVAYTLPADFTSVRADFEGNLYCLDAGGNLYQNGELFAELNGADFVYSTTSLSADTFALGFEDDEVYFGFGNFVVKSDRDALGFPTLGTISADGIYEEVSRLHDSDELQYVDLRQGAVGIAVDLSTFDETTEYFPYASYSRTPQAARGVLLAEHGDYRLVALYLNRAYEVKLFRAEQCTPAEHSFEEEEGTSFLSSSAYLYNYPCVVEAHSEEPVPRGTLVQVLGVVHAGESEEYGYDFALVEFVGGMTRAITKGYVPLSFLTAVNPNGSQTENYLLGYLKAGAEATFTAEDGEEVLLSSGEQLRLYENDDGTYTAVYTQDGKTYSAQLTEDMIDWGTSDAWRIALIIGLSVLAVIIIGADIYLLPKKKKNTD